jgi:LacI family transcriptional regulator
VILASTGGDVEVEKSELQIMVRRQVDGVILVAADSEKSDVKSLMTRKVPIAVFDEPLRDQEVDTITVTNCEAAREATDHLLAHGYRRILVVGARPFLFTCAERVAGYRSAMRSAGAEPIELLVEHEKDLTPEALSAFVSGPNRVEAIFLVNWVCTMRVLRGLNALKRRIPKDVALVSFDDFELADMIPPGLTVVRQPSHELGHRAATTLFERIEDVSDHPPRKIVLNTEFVVRGSCGCKPK